MNILVLAISAAIVLAAILLVLIHNHKAVANASAQLDALAIKVDPVIRASEADISQLTAKVSAAAAPAASVTGQAVPVQVQTADVAGAQPAAAPVQVQ